MARFKDSRKSERVEHKAVPMTTPGQQPASAAVDESAERTAGVDASPPVPEPDRKTKLVRSIEKARVLAGRLGDESTLGGLSDLSERVSREQLDEAGFEDLEKLVVEIQKGLEEAAGPAVIRASFEDMPAEEHARLVGELRKSPPMPVVGAVGVALVTGAVENLEQEARKAAAESRIQDISDEKEAVEHIRRVAVPGESLVQAVERLEKLANTGADLLPMVGGDLKTRAVGVIVEDVGNERHVVHVFERGGGSLRVWAYNKGEKMPWHATRDVVEKLVETRITPEDKR
jgi:hypothetical protein